MRCPKCQFDHPLQTTDCLKCGIVFSKYNPPPDASAAGCSVPGASSAAEKQLASHPAIPSDARMAETLVSSFNASLDEALSPDAARSPVTEFKYRLVALPLALLVARWLTSTGGFNLVAGMLAMVVHESGHAITSWLAGRWAIPTFWFTMMGQNRSWFIVVLVLAALFFGGYQAWRAQRWGWVCAVAAVLLLQINILALPEYKQGAVIIFAGDGGALVLATILMATFYAPRDSALAKSWGLRWGLLLIGALAFMHVYRLWSGPWENIPFGEIEGRNFSDPSLLTQMYGWTVIQLVDRYLRLAKACFIAMGAVYLWGLAAAYLAMRSRSPQQTYKGLNAPATR